MPIPAFAAVESPELAEVCAAGEFELVEDGFELVGDEFEGPPDVVVVELGAEFEDVEEMKSAALYRIETPKPFTASVLGCSVTISVVRATASIASVVSTAPNMETHAWPGKLKSTPV